MAVINAANTGNWSSASTWPGGVFPTNADDVHANGKTVTIDQDISVLSLRTTIGSGGVTGGTFSVVSSRTINAPNIYVGSSSCVVCNLPSGATVVINGNCLGTLNTASGDISAVENIGSGTVTITGNAEGSGQTSLVTYGIRNAGGSVSVLNVTGTIRGGAQGNAFGIIHQTQGTTNVFGDVYANNTGGNRGRGLRSAGTGVVNITGNVYGQTSDGVDFFGNGGQVNIIGNVYGGAGFAGFSTGFNNTVTITGNIYPGTSNANGHGVTWSGGGTCTINGDVFGDNISGTSSGANGVRNNSTGTVIINGNVRSGNFGTAAWNNSSGTIVVSKAIGNSYGPGSSGSTVTFGIYNNGQGVVRLKQIECGSRGALPVYGTFTLDDDTSNVLVCKLTTSGTKSLTDPNATGTYPTPANVRSGVSYASGNFTGTCAVPAASSVAAGVPVDNTVGTAALTPASVWGYALSSASGTAGSVGEKLKKTAIPADIIALG